MKITIIITAALIVCANITTYSQNVYIPDANFKKALVNNPKINTNGDTAIQVSEAVAYKNTIDVYAAGIKDLTGIEAFTALITLVCRRNSLTTLNLSANKALITLDCSDNKLTTLNASANKTLDEFRCSDNLLTTLNISTNKTLTILDCSNNKLTTLDVSVSPALTYLICSDNLLTNLNVSTNKALVGLECLNNQLKTIDISANKVLGILNCSGNQLTTLNMSANYVLASLDCHNNQLTTLNVSTNSNLAFLYCNDNKLAKLDVSSCFSLMDLYCFDNKLTSLNLRNGNNSGLSSFSAKNNPALHCIQVDSVNYSDKYWANNIDTSASFSTDCNYTGIEEQTTNTNLSIFPNPANSQLTISTKGNKQNVKLSIVNIMGKELMNGRLQNETTTIDISHLSNGIYFVKVGDEVKKLVKE